MPLMGHNIPMMEHRSRQVESTYSIESCRGFVTNSTDYRVLRVQLVAKAVFEKRRFVSTTRTLDRGSGGLPQNLENSANTEMARLSLFRETLLIEMAAGGLVSSQLSLPSMRDAHMSAVMAAPLLH